MGLIASVLQVPLRLLSTCIGTCAAVGCLRLAGAGTVTNARAASCVLAWLQICSALLALTVRVSHTGWIEGACEKLSTLLQATSTTSGPNTDMGICSCQESTLKEKGCWPEQLVYRAAATTCAVYLLLVLLALSGCALGASRYYSVGKFLAVILLWTASLLAPNGVFNAFGAVASLLSSLFGVVQCILVLDVACTIHEAWFDLARRSKRRKNHEQAIVLASLALAITAWASAVVLWQDFPQGWAHGLILATEAGSLVLLVVSITDWCEHGTLLTSAAMMLFSTWLLYGVLVNACVAIAPGETLQPKLEWPRLAMCAATVLLIARNFGLDTQTQGLSQGLIAGGGDELDVGVSADPAAPMSEHELRSFIIQSLMHAIVPLYWCSTLTSDVVHTHCLAFIGHTIVLGLSSVIYAWHLVAPKILTRRRF